MSDIPPRFDDLLDEEPRCESCGCTDSDCSHCIAITGEPCSWAAPGLCSCCLQLAEGAMLAMSATLAYSVGVSKEPPPSLEGLSLEMLLAAPAILARYASTLPPREDGAVVAPLQISDHMIAAIFALHALSGMPLNRDKLIICKNADVMLVVTHNPDKRRVWMPGDPR